MKLYAWKKVLTDYSDGIICIFAKSEEHAWDLLFAIDSTAWWVMQGEPKGGDANYNRLKEKGKYKLANAISPREVINPEAFVMWGGS